MKIIPHIGVDALEFGMKRAEIHDLLSQYENLRSLGETTNTPAPSDDYDDIGLSIKYTQFNKCGAIQLSANTEATLNETNLFDLSWNEIIVFLRSLDESIQLRDDSIHSQNLGILITQEGDRADQLLIFQQDFFSISSGAPSPSRISSFFIQIGFVEDVEINNTRIATIEKAAQSVFSNTLEKGIVLWNSMPVSFNYTVDFPAFVRNITPILTELHWSEKGDALFSIKTDNLDFGWRLKWKGDALTIDSEWRKVPGNYQGALNTSTMKKVEISKTRFMEEWKMLLVQFDRAVEAHALEFSELDSQDVQLQVVDLLTYIKSPGKFYLNVPKSEFNYRSDRSKFWKRIALALLIVGGGFIALYVIGNESKQDVFWWLKEHWVLLLFSAIFISIFLALLPLLLRKK